MRDGTHRLAPLGDRLVVADRRLPGGPAARRQRRHAGVPLVGEGPRRGDRHQPPEGRDGARAPPLRRPRPAVRRRGQPREHPLRRRAAQPADDEHGRSSATARGGSARTTSPTSPTPTTSPARSRSSIREVVSELWSAAQQRRLDVQPRVHRGFVYSLMRAWGTIIQRDLQVQAVIADIYAGRPVTYTTFLAYDEVAHHSGHRAPGDAAHAAPGGPRARAHRGGRRGGPAARTAWWSSPTTGSRRARRSWTATASRSSSSCASAAQADSSSVRPHPTRRSATSAPGSPRRRAATRRGARAVRRVDEAQRGRSTAQPRARQGRRGDGAEDEAAARARRDGLRLPRARLVPAEPGRVTLEQLEERYPRVVPALRDHPGVGFLLVRSRRARRRR